MFAVNAKGMFFTLQAVARRMIARGKGGKIINFSSQAGRRGEALVSCLLRLQGGGHFCLTQSAGLDLIKHHINVNGISPGVADTPMWDHVDSLFAKYEHRPMARKSGWSARRFRSAAWACPTTMSARGVSRVVRQRLRRRPDAQRRRRQLDELRPLKRPELGERRRERGARGDGTETASS